MNTTARSFGSPIRQLAFVALLGFSSALGGCEGRIEGGDANGHTGTGGSGGLGGPVICNGVAASEEPPIAGSQVSGPALARPFFPVNGPDVASSNELIEAYTEDLWVRLVPTQSPRQNGPTCPDGSDFTWDSRDPDLIRCGTTTYDPGNADELVNVTVLSGKTILLPAWSRPDGSRTFLKARIDFEKWRFWQERLPMLAATYQQTKDDRYARRVALVLDRWAENFPDWYLSNLDDDDPISPEEATSRQWLETSRASPGDGVGFEIHQGMVEAFERIYDSPAWEVLSAERGYDVRQRVIDNYFMNAVDFLIKTVPLSTHARSSVPHAYATTAKLAVVLGRPEINEWYVEYLKLSVQNLKRDGMFPESFGYHHEYVRENLVGVSDMLRFFEVWPPENEAARALQEKALHYAAFFQAILDASLLVATPNGHLAPFGDTHYDSVGVPSRDQTSSQLLPAYGHATLGAGQGENQTQVNFGFSDNAKHMHKDVLSFTLFAFDRELLSDIRYSRVPGRAFTESTVAHSTVTIDQQEQHRGNHQGPSNQDHLFTNGNLLLFEPDLAGFSLAEVDGSYAYTNVSVERYQRTLILNSTDATHPYIVDLFRVKGGSVHDYFLHSSTLRDHTMWSSLTLSAAPSFGTCNPDGDWYAAFRNMKMGRSPGQWHATLQEIGGSHGTRIFGVDNGDTTLFLGESPAPYRNRNDITTAFCTARFRPSLMLRHEGTDTLFITIIEPFAVSPAIARIDRLPLSVNDHDHVGLKIIAHGGREDVLLVDLTNQRPSAEASGPALSSQDGLYLLEGRVGFASTMGTAKLIAGKRFVHPGGELTLESGVLKGTILEIIRKVGGCSHDAFVTDVELPEGDTLRGRWIRLAFDTYHVVGSAMQQKGLTEFYRIDHVQRAEGKTFIVLDADPALGIRDGKVIEFARPHRTFEGPLTFEIALSISR